MMLESADTHRLQDCVERYGARHRHPDRPRFIIHDAYTMTSWEGTEVSYKAGCYAIYSGAGELLYVGKASNTKSAGSRIVRFK